MTAIRIAWLLAAALLAAGCPTPDPLCFPDCEGRVCGDDGCGRTCGSCQEGSLCVTGSCVCARDCFLKDCGPDGCGGVCGSCPAGFVCQDNHCACIPSCTGRTCGDDGCGGTCGVCQGAQICYQNHCCTPNCDDRECGIDGCGGDCGTCPVGFDCEGGKCGCEPQCQDRVCGNDGCWGSCGECPQGLLCFDGQCCVGDCTGRVCGDDGCGGSCGECEPGTACDDFGSCGCPWQCGPRVCGDDGCGGLCGVCPEDEECVEPFGYCCAPSCEEKACGDDGCGNSCGVCPSGEDCRISIYGSQYCTIAGLDCPNWSGSSDAPSSACAASEECAAGQDCVAICGWRSCTCASAADCAEPTPYCARINEAGVSACVGACPPPGEICPPGTSCVGLFAGDGTPVEACAVELHQPCQPCEADTDCYLSTDHCADPGTTGSTYCLVGCDEVSLECAAGESCQHLVEGWACVPEHGVCACEAGATGLCFKQDAEGNECQGELVCEPFQEWVCYAPMPQPEVCGDEVDNDCDGTTDEDC